STKPPDDSSTQRRTRIAIYGLTYADYERFTTIPSITQMVPMRIFPQEIRYLERMHNGRVVATTAAYSEVNSEARMTAGRFLNDEDDREMLNVAVIGSAVADKLFPYEDPLKQSVRLGNYFYRIVGVVASRMPLAAVGGSSQSAEDFNNDVYIPLKTCK